MRIQSLSTVGRKERLKAGLSEDGKAILEEGHLDWLIGRPLSLMAHAQVLNRSIKLLNVMCRAGIQWESPVVVSDQLFLDLFETEEDAETGKAVYRELRESIGAHEALTPARSFTSYADAVREARNWFAHEGVLVEPSTTSKDLFVKLETYHDITKLLIQQGVKLF